LECDYSLKKFKSK